MARIALTIVNHETMSMDIMDAVKMESNIVYQVGLTSQITAKRVSLLNYKQQFFNILLAVTQLIDSLHAG